MNDKIEPTDIIYQKLGIDRPGAPFGVSYPVGMRDEVRQPSQATVGLQASIHPYRGRGMGLQPSTNQPTSNDMTVTREEIDAKLAASEARVDARLAEMSGKFDLVLAKMDTLTSAVAESRQDSKEESRHIRNTQWAAAGVLLAILGLGITLWFGGIDLGTKISEVVDQKIEAGRPAEQAPAPVSAPANEPPAPSQK